MNSEDADVAAALDVLSARGWLSQRSQATRRRLAGIARLRNFRNTEPIYLAGDAPNGIFGLVSGSITVSFPRGDGEDYVMHRFGAGVWFGDLALFSRGVRLVSVHATEATTAIHLPPQDLERLVHDEPALYADFYEMTYENFLTAFKVITNLAIPSADKRVADRLVLETATRADSAGWIALSQPELARLIAVSLPTLQRLIRRFVGEGIVEQGYGCLRVVDPDALRRICQQ
ncbi:MAG: Crp/Fnr family transcriptional regulator [Rhodospirillales bacterium]